MPRQLLRTFTLALACAGAACSCVEAAEPYVVTGKTVAVQDGDTITVLDSANVQHKIRLAEIDAPELKQPYGQDAKATLSSLVFGKKVTVTVASKDRYQRELGNVVVGKIDVNGTMVKWGYAHVYTAYKHRAILLDYELEAREADRGLWADQKAIILPWLWRKGSRP